VAPGLSPGISSPTARLAALGLELPPAAVLAAGMRFSYRRLVRAGSVGYLAGHLPAWGEELRYRGRVGAEVSLEEGVDAARLCALSMLRTVADELGSVDAIEGWLRVTGFVRGVAGFDGQPAVLNGFTDLVRDVWGEDALPSRSAVGVAELPFGVCIEVDAVVQLAD
jgi:enamine deaminase RidA (YjgF/YER057c/UK114 family)